MPTKQTNPKPEPKPKPDKACYGCLGTGEIVWHSVPKGTPCPCLHADPEGAT